MRHVLLLAPLAGCAQIFGIHTTSGATPDDPATLRFDEVQIGATVVRGPADLTTSSAQFLIDDPDQPSGVLAVTAETSATGDTWSADIAGDPTIEFTLPDAPDPMQRLWAYPSRAVSGLYQVFGHPDPVAPDAMAALMVDVTLPTAWDGTEAFELDAIGPWAAHQLTAAELPAVAGGTEIGPVAIPYASFSSLVATGDAFSSIVPADQLVFLRYAAGQLTGAYQVPSFAQSSGADPVTGTLVEVTPATAVGATVDPTGLATRFAAIRPAVSAPAITWAVYASPGAAIGQVLGPQLASGTVATTDTQIAAMYGDPFPSWPAMLQYVTSAARTFMDGTVPVSLGAGAYTVASPGTGLTLDLPAGLPALISIGDTHLASDGVMVTLDLTHPVDVSFVADRPASTVYRVFLSELVPDAAGTSVTRSTVVIADTAETVAGIPHFAIPPALFEVGHTYTLTAVSILGGFTNAATGDLETFGLPFSVAYLDSGAFTVAQ